MNFMSGKRKKNEKKMTSFINRQESLGSKVSKNKKNFEL